MKIGLSTNSIEPTLNRGIIDGIGHYTSQVCECLTKRGYSVVPYAFPRFFRKHDLKLAQPLLRSYPVCIVSSFSRIYNRLSIPVDVFHSTDYRVVPMNCPVVANLWDAIAFVHPEWICKGLHRILVPKLLKQSAKYADRVICASEYAAEEVAHYFGVPQDRIRIIPWSISEKWKKPEPLSKINAVRNKYNLPEEYILSVGTLQPRKNFSRLIDAFISTPISERKNIKLLIVGKPRWGNSKLIAKISRNRPDIIYLNNIDNDDDLRCIYQGARIFVFPSLYEGFGMPILEAFASKVPVVASNITSVPEVAGDAALLVDPLSVELLSKALREILSSPSISSDLISKGYKRLDMFVESRMIEKTLRVYEEVL